MQATATSKVAFKLVDLASWCFKCSETLIQATEEISYDKNHLGTTIDEVFEYFIRWRRLSTSRYLLCCCWKNDDSSKRKHESSGEQITLIFYNLFYLLHSSLSSLTGSFYQPFLFLSLISLRLSFSLPLDLYLSISLTPLFPNFFFRPRTLRACYWWLKLVSCW